MVITVLYPIQNFLSQLFTGDELLLEQGLILNIVPFLLFFLSSFLNDP